MKSYRLMFLIVVATVLLACQPATSTSNGSGTAASVDQWKTFSSKEGGFTLSLPGKPQEQRQPVGTASGSVNAIMYIAEVGSTAFGVGYGDYPGSAANVDPQAVLKGARDGAAKNVSGTLVSEKPIELAGYPGLEIAVETPASAKVLGGAMYRARLYLVGNRLYQVIYVALKKDDHPDEYQKLFDSFRLDNPPAPNAPSSGSALKDWIEYRSEAGGFTVLLPDQPEVKTQATDTAAGAVPLTTALTEMQNYAAGVSFNDLPAQVAADPETVLSGGRKGAAQNLKGTVISEKPIKLGTYPGTEFVVETPNNLIYTARIYVVNDRLYQILFLTSKDQIDQFDVQGFFDSFKLLEK